MAVPVRLGTEFEWQGATALFSAPIDIGMAVNAGQYFPAPRGDRFLMIVPAHDQSTSISIILNWTAALKK